MRWIVSAAAHVCESVPNSAILMKHYHWPFDLKELTHAKARKTCFRLFSVTSGRTSAWLLRTARLPRSGRRVYETMAAATMLHSGGSDPDRLSGALQYGSQRAGLS